MTLDALIEKHNVKEIDFLKIDIEGMEHIVLSSYSWKIKPKLMKIEVNWHNDDLLKHFQTKFAGLGYLVYKEATDWYCILAR